MPLAVLPVSADLAPGEALLRVAQVTLPLGIPSDPWIEVCTNAGGELVLLPDVETCAVEQVCPTCTTPDVVPTATLAPPTAEAGAPVTLGWTVRNDGFGAAGAPWQDRVVLVREADGVVVAEAFYTHLAELAAGAEEAFALDLQVPGNALGEHRLRVDLDVANHLHEPGGELNNASIAGAITLIEQPQRPDLVVDVAVLSASDAVAGDVIEVTWSATNSGEDTADAPWLDRVYLTDQPGFDPGQAELRASVSQQGALAPGQSYPAPIVRSVVMPQESGTYRVYVVIDALDDVDEGDGEPNNVTLAGEVLVAPPPRPNLTVVAGTLLPPGAAPVGAMVAVSWDVINDGEIGLDAGDGGPENVLWNERIYASADPFPGADVLLASHVYSDALPVGGVARRTRMVPVPALSNGYFIVVQLDPTQVVSETNEADNLAVAAQPSPVLLPDLAVSNVLHPAAGLADDVVNVSWTVTNASAEATAFGPWLDTIYLRKAGGSVLEPIGSRPRTAPLAPGAPYDATLAVPLPGLALGDYDVLVQADAGLAVAEAGELDNLIVGGTITIGQPDRPNLVVESVDLPADALVGRSFTASWITANVGAAGVAASFTDRIYAIDVESGVEHVVGFATNTSPLTPGSTLPVSAAATMPSIPGTYRLAVVTDRTNAINEGPQGGELDNRGETAGTFLSESFLVSADTVVVAEPTPAVVPISGTASTSVRGLPAVDVPVQVAVDVQGSRRLLSAVTNGTGQYSVNFLPLPTEAGAYTLRAGPAGAIDETPADAFDLYGMEALPGSQTLLLYPGLEGDITAFVLRNRGDNELNGLTVEIPSTPPGVTLSVLPEASQLGPFGSTLVNVSAVADQSVSMQLLPLTLSFGSAQGAIVDVDLILDVRPPAAMLASAPTALIADMQVPETGGDPIQTMVQLTLTNVGAGVSEPVQVLLPALPWMSVATATPLAPLMPGESAVLTLLLEPAEGDVPPGASATGNLLVVGGSGTLSVPFTLTAFQDGEASMLVTVTDEGTYWSRDGQPLVDGPKVADATVTVRRHFTQELVDEITTGADGLAYFEDLAPGYYDIRTSAAAHGSISVTRLLAPGESLELEAFVPYVGVTYTWTVEPTEIEDQYVITVDLEFEVDVPAPVVTLTPQYVDLDALSAAAAGQPFQVDYTITNVGLIQADDLRLSASGPHGYTLTPLAHELGDLGPGESVVVPVVVNPVSSLGDGGCAPGYVVAEWTLVCGIPLPYSATAVAHDASDCPLPPPPPPVNFDPPSPSGSGGPGGGTTCLVPPSPSLINLSCDCIEAVFGCVASDCPSAVLDCGRPTICYLTPACVVKPGQIADCVISGLKCAGAVGEKFLAPVFVYTCACSLIRDCVLDADLGAGDIPCGIGDLVDIAFGATSTSGLTAGTELPSWSGFIGSSPNPVRQLAITQFERMLVVLTAQWYPFGTRPWLEVSDQEQPLLEDWKSEFVLAADEASDGGEWISAAEITQLHALARPANLTAADLDAFFARWNRTVEYWDAGILATADVPPGFDTDFIDLEIMSRLWNAAWDAIEGAQAEGFAGINEAWAFAENLLQQTLQSPDEGVCATVAVQIDQTVAVTRGAFRAALTLDNGSADMLEAVQVQIDVSTLDGTPAGSLFLLQLESSSIPSWDGMSTLPPGGSATGSWLLIPSDAAAPIEPVPYLISGTLSLVQSGVFGVWPLAPITVEVWPNAELEFRYFIERDVYGDDPYGPPIEPSVPFDLGLLVTNSGAGSASSITVTSAQPVIVDNEDQLAIEFQILGSQVGTQPSGPSLTANLGGLGPGAATSARWHLLSPLDGQFISYSASIENLNGIDDPEFWVVDPQVDVRPMLRSVRADEPHDDGVFDFLDLDPLVPHDALPQTLWTSDGEAAPVTAVFDSTATVVPGEVPTAELTVALDPAAWTYVRLADPFGGEHQLTGVVRGDGKSLLVGPNAWQTKRTLANDPGMPTPHVHLFDKGGDGSYTLVFEQDVVPPRVLSWTARAGHGDLGIGSELIPGAEPWSDSHLGGPRVLRVAFSEPVDSTTFVPENLRVFRSRGLQSGLPVAFTAQVTNGGSTADIVLAEAIPSRSRLCVELTGVLDLAGNPLCPEDAALDVVALLGDIDGDLDLDLHDLALLDGLLGTDPLDLGEAAHLRADLDRDGKIDATDRAILGSQITGAAPTLPPACFPHGPPASPCSEDAG